MNDYGKYNDEKLIKLLREGSPARDWAFDAIFNRYSAKLNAFCSFKSAAREDAEELFGDIWLKFLDRIDKGKQLDNILPYLYSIARTLAIDKYRQKKSVKSIGLVFKSPEELDELINPFILSEQIEKEELISIIKLAVESLDDIYQDVFIMQWFGGLSQKEIAEALELSIGAVKMRCHRAMTELIKILKPYLEDSIK